MVLWWYKKTIQFRAPTKMLASWNLIKSLSWIPGVLLWESGEGDRTSLLMELDGEPDGEKDLGEELGDLVCDRRDHLSVPTEHTYKLSQSVSLEQCFPNLCWTYKRCRKGEPPGQVWEALVYRIWGEHILYCILIWIKAFTCLHRQCAALHLLFTHTQHFLSVM